MKKLVALFLLISLLSSAMIFITPNQASAGIFNRYNMKTSNAMEAKGLGYMIFDYLIKSLFMEDWEAEVSAGFSGSIDAAYCYGN